MLKLQTDGNQIKLLGVVFSGGWTPLKSDKELKRNAYSIYPAPHPIQISQKEFPISVFLINVACVHIWVYAMGMQVYL